MNCIKYYKTDTGILVSHIPNNPTPIINGVSARKSFNRNWIVFDGIFDIQSIEYPTPAIQINARYLRKEYAPKTLPEIFTVEELPEYFDNISDFYQFVADYKEQPNKSVEFETELLGEFKMEILGDPTSFKFSLHPKDYDKKVSTIDYSSIFSDSPWMENEIHVEDIVKSVVPDFAWHLHPCSLSSRTSYRIIRQYVKTNINPKVARVTSDYNFCFAVSKLIPVKPWIHKYEHLNSKGKSYRPPRIVESKKTHKEIPIFEMTPKEEKYREYPVLEGFKGESLKDLENNITRYLNELIELINRPLSLCSNCDGRGHIEEFIDVNRIQK